jgi:hypothetical protein
MSCQRDSRALPENDFTLSISIVLDIEKEMNEI